jgi:hypothetical protein
MINKVLFWNKVQMTGFGLFLGFLIALFIYSWWYLIPASLGIVLSMFGYARKMKAAGRDPATADLDEVI